MINDDIYKTVTPAEFHSCMYRAINLMAQSSNKLILVLRDKTDTEECKSIISYAKENKIKRVNLGLQLSKYLLEYDVSSINEYLRKELKSDDVVIVDNAEILFDSGIEINAFTLFKDLARHQILIVVLDGHITKDGKFVYGSSSNKDYFQYEKLTDTYILDLNGGAE